MKRFAPKLAVAAVVGASLGLAGPAVAQTPTPGGILNFVVGSKIPSYAFSRTEPAQVSECGSLTKDDLDLKSRTLLATVFAEDYRRFGYELPDASTSKSALATMLQDDKKLQRNILSKCREIPR